MLQFWAVMGPQWCCSLRWGSLWPISDLFIFLMDSSFPVLTNFYCFTILKEWTALIGVVSWDGRVAWFKLKQKGEAEYWRVQGQVLKCPSKIIIALSYLWSFNIWTCTPQNSGMCWWLWKFLVSSVSYHRFMGWKCSEGEALSVATLEKLQPEHHYEISSPEMLVKFGCPLLVRTWMNQIYGVIDKLYLTTAHAQKHLWWHLHCRDQIKIDRKKTESKTRFSAFHLW